MIFYWSNKFVLINILEKYIIKTHKNITIFLVL